MGTPLASSRTLIVPGLNNSGPGHWQSRWQLLYPEFERVEQAHWEVPDLEAWSAQLRNMLNQDDSPTLIVAHSFGCLATAHCALSDAPNLLGVLLVAPADPDKFSVSATLRNARLPCPAIVIGSIDDPWMSISKAAYWAETWGAEFVNAGALGHINAESNLGVWEF